MISIEKDFDRKRSKKNFALKTPKLAHLYHFHLIGYNRVLNIGSGEIEIGVDRGFVSHHLHVVIFILNECVNCRRQCVCFSQLREPCTPGTWNGIYCGVMLSFATYRKPSKWYNIPVEASLS